MPEALLVVDGDDPGAVMLGAALRRHGWRVRHLDLRYGRPTLDGSGAEPVVRLDGAAVVPDLVLNRTATSRLGLAPGNALARQQPATWWGKHLAAREEQGLLLACLDLWDRTGRLYNPVATLDRRVLRPATAADLRAAGAPLGPPAGAGRGGGAGTGGGAGAAADGRLGVAWLVDGAVVASATRAAGQPWRVTPLSGATAERLRRTAEVTGLRLGQLDLWQPREGPTVVTDWRPVPWFRSYWERTGVDVAALVVAALVGAGAPAGAPGFLADDLEGNVRRALRRGVTRS